MGLDIVTFLFTGHGYPWSLIKAGEKISDFSEKGEGANRLTKAEVSQKLSI